MEWRIILPVVCVLGILFVPGSTAQDPSASTNGTSTNGTSTNGTSTNAATNGTATNSTGTNATATNATATNATATNATATNVTATNATANNVTATNATATNATATNVTATNATANNATATNATATNATATNATATNATATNATATNASVTNATATNVTATNATANNATATNAIATNASVTNATGTNATATNPTATNATATNATATNATATNSTSANSTGTNVTTTNATATNTTSTNVPASHGTNTSPTNSAVTKSEITYSIDQPFKNEFTDLDNPETKILKDKITSQIEPLYKKLYENFRRYVIRRFRNGSIVTDGDLEFNAGTNNPNVSELTKVLVEAVRAGNLTFQIKNDSISITAPATTAAPLFNTTATNPTAANANATNATVTNATATNPTATNATATNATATNATATNSTSANSTGTNVTTTNATATNTTSTNVPASHGTTTNPTNSAVTKSEISYSIDQPFKNEFTDLDNPETKILKDKITSQIEPLYKKRYENFRRYVIRRFRNGSIVTDGDLEFNAGTNNPNVSELTKVLVEAVRAGNLTFQIKNDSISITAPATTAAPLFNTSLINVTFSIKNNFTEALSNISSTEAMKLTNNITTEFVTAFKRRYANILRMLIRKFRNGSIVTEGALEFSDNGTIPKAQEVINFIVEAAKGGNFTFPVDVTSVNATDSSVVPVTPPTSTPQINVTFSIKNNFTEALSNMSSPEAMKLTKNITTEFVTVFKKRYTNILRMLIRKFRNGSIVTEGALEFSGGTVPNAQEVVNFIVKEVNAGSFPFPVDVKSITATDSLGGSATSHGSSTVISSMFTVLCMALASLLLSGVMHQ